MDDMVAYPIESKGLNREVWNRKVSSTLMSSFALEEETIPTLKQIRDLLTRLVKQPIHDTLTDQDTHVIPPTCQKLISSRYFRSQQVLTLANSILSLSLEVYGAQLDFIWTMPKLAQLISVVLDPDATYFRTNNQLPVRNYPWQYYQSQPLNHEFLEKLTPGDHVDLLKYDLNIKKACWSRAELIKRGGGTLELQYLNDIRGQQKLVEEDSIELAPIGTRSTDFEWRLGLKVGDLVDCCEHEGNWYVSTITKIKEGSNGGKLVRVGLRVYCEDGEKYDSKGRYNGNPETFDLENIDVTSPRIQRPATIARPGDYAYSRSIDAVNDFNDLEFEEINGERLNYIPRSKYLSELLFKATRKFMKDEGYSKLLERLSKENNWDVLVPVVSSLGNIAANLHRNYLREIIERLKPIVHNHLVDDSEANNKKFSREKCDAVFKGMKALLKRVQSTEETKDYENTEKLGLTLLCINSDTLKRRIQGVNELKDVVRTYRVYLSSRIPKLVEWLNNNSIFEKVYIINTHYELLKRSGEYFRFLVLEDALSNEHLALMFQTAQRCDHDSKLAYYKIFQEVSRHMKKEQINFIIDQILETEGASVSCEDINLLYDLEKESNYFPLEKVLPFFERIFMNGKESDQIVETCLKKYIDIVGSKDRKDTVKRFLGKLKDAQGNPDIVLRVLRTTIDAEYSRYDLLQLLQQNNLDRIVLDRVKDIKQANGSLQTVRKLLDFLSWTASLSQTRVKISIECFVELWKLMVEQGEYEEEKEIFYEWTKVVCKEEELAAPTDNLTLYTDFFEELTKPTRQSTLTQKALNIVKYLFLVINRANAKMNINSVIRNHRETTTFKIKVPLPELDFYDRLVEMVYGVNEDAFQSIFSFFRTLYCSQDISTTHRMRYLETASERLFKFYEQGDFQKVTRSISMLQCIIEESEREGDASLQSLAKMRKGQPLTLDILNDVVYTSDLSRKLKVKTTSNTTLLDLKKVLSQLIHVHWMEMRLTQKDEFDDFSNSKFLQDLNLKLDEPITVTKKVAVSVRQEPMVIDGKMNPKAIEAINKIFLRYSTDGKMNSEHVRQFIGGCIGDTTKQYKDKVEKLFSDYDTEKKNYLVVENIIDFFERAAMDKPMIVSSNFTSLGIRPDFRLFEETEAESKQEDLPRWRLSQNPKFYEVVFQMLDGNEKLARPAWRLLERLPVSKSIYEQVINIDETKLAVLERSSPYKLLYCLELYEYFLNSEKKYLNESELAWRDHFLNNGGYDQLFELFCKLNQQPTLKDTERRILEFLLRMLSEYICGNYSGRDISTAIAIYNSELELDGILEFMKTGSKPKSCSADVEKEYLKLSSPTKQEGRELQMNVDMDSMLTQLIRLLERLSSKGTGNIEVVCEIDHCFSLLLHLLADHIPPPELMVQLQKLLKNASSALTQKIFKLVIGLTKACQPTSECPTLIIEWLFSLQSRTNNPYYLKTLIVLTDRHGIPAKIRSEPKTLIDAIIQSENEYLIGGCSQLLLKIESSYDLIDDKLLQALWEGCLFGANAKCKAAETRESIYELILKVVDKRKELTCQLWKLTTQTLKKVLDKSKLVNPNDLQSRSPYGYVGLKNIGNICYMLAMLQQFFHNPTFRHLLLRIDDGKPSNTVTIPSTPNSAERQVDDNMLHQLRKMFGYLQSTTRLDFAPHDFCYSFKGFSGEPVNVGVQQDAQEFVSMIFDKLEDAIKGTPFKRVIDSIYRGKLTNTLTCSKCKKAKHREEIFYSLQVDIKNSKTLPDSLKKVCQGQTINDYHCQFCNEKADVSKTAFISHCPNFIIIHLQRIVFNMDTFINEKINTRFEFPMQIDLSPYVGEPEQKDRPIDENQYELAGVVVHYGTAEAGHYYSFIKSEHQQWLELNDSKVSGFDNKNIEAQCFGSNTQPSFLDDQIELSKRQHSQSAYMLIYEKKKKLPVQLVFDSEITMEESLKKYELVAGEIHKPEVLEAAKSEQGKSIGQDEIILDDEPPEVLRKFSKEEHEVQINKPEPVVEVEKPEEVKEVKEQKSPQKEEKSPQKESEKQPAIKPEIVVDLAEPLTPYMPPEYQQEIVQDNLLHELQLGVCSPAFTKYFSRLLKQELPVDSSGEILELTQRMVFKVWLKNPGVKDIMNGLQTAIRMHPEVAMPVIRNKDISTLLLESPEADIRTSVSLLLASCVSSVVEHHSLPLTSSDKDNDVEITLFLDDMFSQLTTTVAKQWQKFSQWFEFWKHLATFSPSCLNYLFRKEAISNFIDFQLEKKSPLKIHADKKYTLGNRYTQPSFSSMFELIGYLLGQVDPKQRRLSKNDRLILTDHSFLDKIISDKNDKLARQIVEATCPNSLHCSEKVTLVLLKGFNKGFDSVQPYLEVAETLVTISDAHQRQRIMWVLGWPSLVVSTELYHLVASNSSSLQERIYVYNSTIQYDLSCSLLESLFKSHINTFNSCALTLKGLLKMCQNDVIFDYVFELPPPNYLFGRYYCFFKEFIDNYKKEATLPNSYNPFPRQELAKELEQLYQLYCIKLEERLKVIDAQPPEVEVSASQQEQYTTLRNGDEENKEQQPEAENEIPAQPIPIRHRTEKSESKRSQNSHSEEIEEFKAATQEQPAEATPPARDMVKYPIRYQFFPIEGKKDEERMEVKMRFHNSKVTELLMPITGRKGDYFENIKIKYRLIDRITGKGKKSDRREKGVLVRNNARDYMRVKWEYGSCYLRQGESQWIWTDNLDCLQVTKSEREYYDWPRWHLHKDEE